MKTKILAAPDLIPGKEYFLLAKFANPSLICDNSMDSFWVKVTLKHIYQDKDICAITIENDEKVFYVGKYTLFIEQD